MNANRIKLSKKQWGLLTAFIVFAAILKGGVLYIVWLEASLLYSQLPAPNLVLTIFLGIVLSIATSHFNCDQGLGWERAKRVFKGTLFKWSILLATSSLLTLAAHLGMQLGIISPKL